MAMGELMWLGIEALSMKADAISMSVLPGGARYLWEADYGHMQSYYVPDEAELLALINEKLNPYNEPITELNLLDASTYPDSKPVSSHSGDGEDDHPPEEPEPQTPQTPEEPGNTGEPPGQTTEDPGTPGEPEPPAGQGEEPPAVTPEPSTPPDGEAPDALEGEPAQ